MTRAEFAKGSATFVVVIVAGVFSEMYLDRQFAADEIDKHTASSITDETTSSGACVEKDGSWKNWSWSNVPILSPKCRDDR
jgi:hypothetical protein